MSVPEDLKNEITALVKKDGALKAELATFVATVPFPAQGRDDANERQKRAESLEKQDQGTTVATTAATSALKRTETPWETPQKSLTLPLNKNRPSSGYTPTPTKLYNIFGVEPIAEFSHKMTDDERERRGMGPRGASKGGTVTELPDSPEPLPQFKQEVLSSADDVSKTSKDHKVAAGTTGKDDVFASTPTKPGFAARRETTPTEFTASNPAAKPAPVQRKLNFDQEVKHSELIDISSDDEPSEVKQGLLLRSGRGEQGTKSKIQGPAANTRPHDAAAKTAASITKGSAGAKETTSKGEPKKKRKGQQG